MLFLAISEASPNEKLHSSERDFLYGVNNR